MSNYVLLGSSTVSIKNLRLYPGSFSRDMQHAKAAPGYAICQCGYDAKLVIRKNQRDLYFLAAWPSRNGEPIYKHSPACYFHRDAVSNSVNEDLISESIKTSSDGSVKITPAFSLSRNVTTKKSQSSDETLSAHPPRKSNAQVRKATGLSILYALFDMAALNKHDPSQPNNSQSGLAELYQATSNAYLGGQLLCDLCMTALPPLKDQDGVPEDNSWVLNSFIAQTRKRRTRNRIPSALLIGELISITQTKFGYAIRVKHLSKPLFCSYQVLDKMVSQFERELNTLNNPDVARQSHVVMMAQFEVNASDNLVAIGASFMLVSRNYIPVDSLHELRLANFLSLNKRVYEKPLTIQDGLLPDFILRDCEVPVFMEVWGMNTETYKQRKQEKIETYTQRQMILWQWDAVSEAKIPQLPRPILVNEHAA